MSVDPVSLISTMAAAEPAIAAVVPLIIGFLEKNHPTLDLTELRSGVSDYDAARAAALKGTE